MANKRKKPPVVKQHARVVVYPQVVQWPVCEANIRTPEAIRYRRDVDRSHVARRLAQQGLNEIACGNVASYTIDGCWLCRKHAGLVLLDMLAEPPSVLSSADHGVKP